MDTLKPFSFENFIDTIPVAILGKVFLEVNTYATRKRRDEKIEVSIEICTNIFRECLREISPQHEKDILNLSDDDIKILNQRAIQNIIEQNKTIVPDEILIKSWEAYESLLDRKCEEKIVLDIATKNNIWNSILAEETEKKCFEAFSDIVSEDSRKKAYKVLSLHRENIVRAQIRKNISND